MSGPGIALSRRRFLQVIAGAAGALVVGIRSATADDASVPLALLGDTLYGLNPYVRIDTDGNVIIGARNPDPGSGTATAVPRIIADELDADWKRVTVIALGLGVEDDNGKPHWTYGAQTGGLGQAIPAAWADLRQVGALARRQLLQAAAQRLNVPVDRLRCAAGYVIAPDGSRLDYGALAQAAAKIAPPSAPVPLKSPDHYTLIGQPAGDVDARAIVTGQALYALDHYAANNIMQTAVLAHCPWPDGSLESLDKTDTMAVKGVVSVVTLTPDLGLPPGYTIRAPAVAVLAENTWAALQGRAKLKIRWKAGTQHESSAEYEQQANDLLNDADAAPTTRVRDDGDIDTADKHAVRRVEAVYAQPWLAHAGAEPMNCLVTIDKDSATLVVPTQAPQYAWRVVQRLTGLAPDRIHINVPRIGGGYGRRLDHDYIAEAVALAQETERPIKLMWTRDQEMTQDFYRSACVHKLSATLDGKRQIVSWNQRMASASALTGRGFPDNLLSTSEVDANQWPAGLVPNLRSDWYSLPSAIPRGFARGMPHLSNAFAVESFIDEIAHALKEDPLTTHLRLLGEPRQIPLSGGRTLDTVRLLQVLTLVADRIGWENWLRSVNGLGLACWHMDGAYVAHALEVSMQGERLIIERAVCAVDVGRVINPSGLEGCIAGATLDALSNALNLSITYQDGRINQHDWKEYPLASMAQLPNAVEVILVPGDRDPLGASFLAMPTAAPALANAVFRASAVRVRRLPLMKELLRLL